MDSGSVSMELESEPSVWEERYDDVEREGRSRGAVGISLMGVSVVTTICPINTQAQALRGQE